MLRERVLTALLLAPLAIAGVLLLSTKTLAACAGVVFVVGIAEWGRLIGLRTPNGRLAYVLLVSLTIGLIWQYRALGTLPWAVFAGALWWLVAPLWLGHFEFGSGVLRRYVWLKGLVGMLAVVPAWSALILLHRIEDTGPWWVLYVILLIWVADIAAYFAGRRFGHTKLAPRISPGKTLAGCYGALVGAAVYASIASLWLAATPGARCALVALSLVTVAFSIVGDLFESLIKRHSNAKDSGALLPGHGGVFDRFDSLFAALPVFVGGKLVLGL